MSEEALAEREHTRSGYAGLEDGDTAIDMDGRANGANGPSKAASKAKVSQNGVSPKPALQQFSCTESALSKLGLHALQ